MLSQVHPHWVFYTIAPSLLLALQGNVKFGPTRDAQYTGYLRKWIRCNYVRIAFKIAKLQSWRVTLDSGLPFRAGCEWIIDTWNSNSAEAEEGPLLAGRAEKRFIKQCLKCGVFWKACSCSLNHAFDFCPSFLSSPLFTAHSASCWPYLSIILSLPSNHKILQG